jgi:transposase
MVGVGEKERIRRAYFVEGKSIRWIAKHYHHGRRTVRKALRDASPPEYVRKKPPPAPVMDAVKGIVDMWLEEDKHSPRKQRHTAKRVYDRLVEEYGFTGGESTVRKYVRRVRPGYHDVYVPLAYRPGREAQADFGKVKIILAGVERDLHLFCFQLCYSTRRFVKGYLNEKQESFLDGLQSSFRHVGGVPHRVVFDNPKTLVKKLYRGHRRDEHPDFVAFRSHYMFEGHFCNPDSPQEKGHVEGLVGTVRRNAFVPVPEFSGMDEVEEHLRSYCEKDLERKHPHLDMTVGEAYELEGEHLRPLPVYDYPCCRVFKARIGRYNEIRVDTNRYSVPLEKRLKEVTVKVYVDRVEVYHGVKLIASHQRCYEKNRYILDALHYVPLLSRKPGLLNHGKPFVEWKLPDVFERFRRVLSRELDRGDREYIRILLLHEQHGTGEIAKALEHAEKLGCYNADVIELLLSSHDEAELPSRIHYPGMEVAVSPVDLSRYNKLMEVVR